MEPRSQVQFVKLPVMLINLHSYVLYYKMFPSTRLTPQTTKWGQPGMNPGPLAPEARIIPLDHYPLKGSRMYSKMESRS